MAVPAKRRLWIAIAAAIVLFGPITVEDRGIMEFHLFFAKHG